MSDMLLHVMELRIQTLVLASGTWGIAQLKIKATKLREIKYALKKSVCCAILFDFFPFLNKIFSYLLFVVSNRNEYDEQKL